MIMINKTVIPFFLVILIGCKKQEELHRVPDWITHEQHRPQLHFSPPEKWMNDPNGMVFYDNEYHLFYQYYPDSTVWGPMHWGHAVSSDLLHWGHLPIALYPDSLGYIFSGSAVVDWKNTSGLGSGDKPPLVAIYTYHDAIAEKAGKTDYQTQGLAYSNDRGRTWTKYRLNPIVKNPGIKDFRDPKVFWHEESQKWIMTLAVYDHVSFYSSPDLKTWKFESDFGNDIGFHEGVWECPDLFQLKVTGEDKLKWVLLLSINPGGPNGGSATQYFVGNFDGHKFFSETPMFVTSGIPHPPSGVWLDGGRDNYAGVTWSDIPKTDGRRIFMGWMSNWLYGMKVPTIKWRSAMTIPRELTLHRHQFFGFRLHSTPVKELEKLRAQHFYQENKMISLDLDLTSTLGFGPSQMEAVLEIEVPDTSAKFGIELSNNKGELYRIGFDASNRQYFSDRTKSGKVDFADGFADKIIVSKRHASVSTMKWHIFFDVASVEFFGDDGATVMTEIFFPNEDFNQLKFFVEKGTFSLKKADFYSLNSIKLH